MPDSSPRKRSSSSTSGKSRKSTPRKSSASRGTTRTKDTRSSSRQSSSGSDTAQPDADISGTPEKQEHPKIDASSSRQSSSNRPKKPALKLDPKELADHAWEIYLAELAEEGLTTFDDKDCDSLAKRAFETARVFLQHRDRHHPLS
ncbi:MAG: hypothetical protein AAF591_06270 [Verrucomicrobiota bacterium]